MNRTEIVQAYQAADADALLAASEEPHCHYYASVFRRLAATAENAGRRDEVGLFNFLAAIAAGSVDPNDAALSYQAFVLGPERRIVPPELEPNEVEALEVVASITVCRPLRARVLDVLWCARRRHADCRAAVADYLKVGRAAVGSSVHRVQSFRRGVGLARSLGWRQQTFIDAMEVLVAETRTVAASERRGFFACQMFEIVERYGSATQSAEFIPVAQQRAEAAQAATNFHEAEEYYLITARLQHKLGDGAGEQATNTKIGDVFVLRAEQFAATNPPQYMAATHWLAKGIEQLQRLNADPDRLTELRERLGEFQRLSLGELAPIVLNNDLAERIAVELQSNRERVRRALSGNPFPDALLRLGHIFPLSSLQRIRDQLTAAARDAPLQAIFARS